MGLRQRQPGDQTHPAQRRSGNPRIRPGRQPHRPHRLHQPDNPLRLQTSYAHDAQNRLTGIEHKQGANLIKGYAYTLKPNGQRAQIREYDATGTTRTLDYTYDSLNRLVQEKLTDASTPANDKTTDYAYGTTGNRQTRTETQGTLTTTTAYSYDADDRLTTETRTQGTTSSTTRYAWDANGNLTRKTTPTETSLYAWDSDNRLIEVKRGTTEATATTVATYQYDAQGNRIGKTQADGTHIAYLIDSNMAYAQVVEETASGTATESTVYLYGIERIRQTRGGQGSYYHPDGLGSIRTLTDANGNVTDGYDFEAYGTLQGQTGTTANSFLFAGEQFDAEAGLYYNRARYLDTNTGRFTGLDPFEGSPSRPASLNKYAYADNDPVNNSDPSGLMTLGGMMAGLNGVSTLYTVATISFNVATGNYGGAAKDIVEEVVYSKMGGAFGKQVAHLTKEQFGLFFSVWKKNVNLKQIKLGVAPNPRVLGQNLVAMGVLRPSGTQAHHIVGGVTQLGKNTQAKIKAAGVDLNSVMNGVFLPGCGKSKAIGMVHCGKHTAEYEAEVSRRLRNANDKESIINALSEIRNELLTNSFTPLNIRAIR